MYKRQAEAAVYAAKISLCSSLNAKELDSQEAETFWAQLREQQLPAFTTLQADETLYRLALPAACGPLDLGKAGNMSSEIVLEWHGQERWIKGQSDDATFAVLKQLANAHGGHAMRFRQGTKVNPHNQRFTLLSEQTHSQALEPIQARLRASFDPFGVFATNRLP